MNAYIVQLGPFQELLLTDSEHYLAQLKEKNLSSADFRGLIASWASKKAQVLEA
jgi:hypothetical protein